MTVFADVDGTRQMFTIDAVSEYGAWKADEVRIDDPERLTR